MFTHKKIQEYLDSLTANGASPSTVRAYRTDLLLAATAIGDHPDPGTAELLAARWLTANRATWAPRTTLRRLGTLRSFGRWSGATDFLTAYRPPKPAPPTPHPIAEGIPGVLAMIKSTRNPKHRALCALTGLMGLRVGEARTVTPDDFDLTTMTCRVRGKGDKTRIVPVSSAAWKFIEKRYAHALATGERLCPYSDRGARQAIARHARNAGLGDVSSHDMRATFATAAYKKSHNLRAVQELMGHADAKTTQVYTGITAAEMRDAAEVV